MVIPGIILPNVQSTPENPLLQLHFPVDSQVPAFLQEVASHSNAGHVPSLCNSTSPGQGFKGSPGVVDLIGLP